MQENLCDQYFQIDYDAIEHNMREHARAKVGLSARGIKQRFRNYIADEGQTEALKTAKDFVRSYLQQENDGTGLLLIGGVGCGKTHLAAAIANAIIDNQNIPKRQIQAAAMGYYSDELVSPDGSGVRFISVVSLLEKIRASYDSYIENEQDVLAEYMRIKLLILDDLGAEKPTEWVRERLFSLIDYRYGNSLPTVITTNATPRELRDRLGERIADRIKAMCKTCTITSKSHRVAGEGVQPDNMDGQDFDEPIVIPEREKTIYDDMRE